MSYHTNIEFTFSDDPPDVDAVLGRARSYLESRGDEDSLEFVLDQLRRGLEEEEVEFKGLRSDEIEGLMEHVSAGFPGLVFFVRGTGEEFADIWLRLFRNGSIIFRVGPFDEELDATLG